MDRKERESTTDSDKLNITCGASLYIARRCSGMSYRMKDILETVKRKKENNPNALGFGIQLSKFEK